MKAVYIGVYVLDVLVRPVEAIPAGDGAPEEDIRLGAVGTDAAGTDAGEYDLAAAEALAAR